MLKIYNLMFKNINKFNKLILHTIKLKDINKGINFIQKGKATRVSIKF